MIDYFVLLLIFYLNFDEKICEQSNFKKNLYFKTNNVNYNLIILLINVIIPFIN